MVKTVEIHPGASIIILDSVTFCVRFADASVEGGDDAGPVFVCGAARAILASADADRLVAAGVTDKR